MDTFNEPRCCLCSDKTKTEIVDNKIMLSGNISCCYTRGLLWYLKPCCFVSYTCGGKQGTQLSDDIKKELFNALPKKEAYVDADGAKHIVYQVDNKTRTLKMPDGRAFMVINDIKLWRPDHDFVFIGKKQFEEE